MDKESHDEFLALLAPVCRYFAYYTTHEFCRHLDIHGGEQHTRRRAPFGTNVLIEDHPIQALRTSVEECMISNRHHDSDSPASYQVSTTWESLYYQTHPSVISYCRPSVDSAR